MSILRIEIHLILVYNIITTEQQAKADEVAQANQERQTRVEPDKGIMRWPRLRYFNAAHRLLNNQKENNTMTTKEITALIETMNNYDDLAAKAKAKADAIRDSLKEEMLRLDTEELTAGAYILRYTSIISNRFDSTTFKRLYADLYRDFTKPVSSRRFTVSV